MASVSGLSLAVVVTYNSSLSYSIFRTDYGHTEVAAHFGNGKFALLSARHPLTDNWIQIPVNIASPPKTSSLTRMASLLA